MSKRTYIQNYYPIRLFTVLIAFYRVYEKMFASKTTLFISHRLGAVKSADQILVLHNSHLIAMDAHDALINTCEYYRELFETQRGLYYET